MQQDRDEGIIYAARQGMRAYNNNSMCNLIKEWLHMLLLHAFIPCLAAYILPSSPVLLLIYFPFSPVLLHISILLC